MIAAWLVVAMAPLADTAALAHPGHGSKVVLGTLKEVTRDAIVIESVDPAVVGTVRVRVRLPAGTRLRIDKEPLASLDGMIGQRAIVTVDWEDVRPLRAGTHRHRSSVDETQEEVMRWSSGL